MSRIYATTDNGRRFLAELSCDQDGCGATIKPHPQIAESGWVGCGTIASDGERFDFDFCPDHSDRAEPFRVRMEEEMRDPDIHRRRRLGIAPS